MSFIGQKNGELKFWKSTFVVADMSLQWLFSLELSL